MSKLIDQIETLQSLTMSTKQGGCKGQKTTPFTLQTVLKSKSQSKLPQPTIQKILGRYKRTSTPQLFAPLNQEGTNAKKKGPQVKQITFKALEANWNQHNKENLPNSRQNMLVVTDQRTKGKPSQHRENAEKTHQKQQHNFQQSLKSKLGSQLERIINLQKMRECLIQNKSRSSISESLPEFDINLEELDRMDY